MSEVELQARVAAYKASAQVPKRNRKPGWVEPVLDDFGYDTVLAFDQTFSNTGWALVQRKASGLVVHAKGVIKEPPLPDYTGSEDVLRRATWMAQRIHEVMRENINEHYMVVHEMPAVRGYRVESSLLGALGVRLAADHFRVKVTMVSNTHMRAVLTPPDADRKSKKPVTDALNRYLDTKGWNADQRDAVALALTYLYDMKKAQDDHHS